MSTDIAHFAINADDPEASLRFYEALFGWRFEPWGPPGFFRMQRESGPVIALQQRRDLGGVRMTGFECTVAVDDVGAAAEAAVGQRRAPAHGAHDDPRRRRADLLRGPGRQRRRRDAVRA